MLFFCRIRPALVATCLLLCSFAFSGISDASEQGQLLLQKTATPLKIMSFNIRNSNAPDGENAWPKRKEWAMGILREEKVDLAGLQEVTGPQRSDIATLLPEYEMYGITRDPDNANGESTSVLFLRDRFKLLDKGTFWLSETPDKGEPRGWDAACRRTVTWVKLQDKNTDGTFFFFNTHFDHRGVGARAESARLIRRKIPQIVDDLPVILTGDFNTSPTSEPYRILTAKPKEEPAPKKGPEIQLFDTRLLTSTPAKGPDASSWGFQKVLPGRRIDFIFVSKGIKVQNFTIDDRTKEGRFPSDHLPVWSSIVLPEKIQNTEDKATLQNNNSFDITTKKPADRVETETRKDTTTLTIKH